MLRDRAKLPAVQWERFLGLGFPAQLLETPVGEYYRETVLGSVTQVWSPECLRGDPEAIIRRGCVGSGWQAWEAAELFLLSSSRGGTRCAARPRISSVTCPSSAAAPPPPAPLTCTCRMGTTAGVALATATRDSASP